ncbi:MAG: hypothetical protein K2M76_03190 [Muribaculaceae bacterium]|nr:hypothetical protein [Muribaculaceae bacterium]
MRKVLIKLLSEKAGRDVSTPFGSDWLCRDIESKTGEMLSLNTVKRLTGVIDNKGEDKDLHARRYTLDIIARYLGYGDFQELELALSDKSSSFKKSDRLIDMSSLAAGMRVRIEWLPNRAITVESIGKGWFKVIESENSKLLAEDLLQIHQIMQDYPFFVKEVIRDKESLGSYTAAEDRGVMFKVYE